ncbi:1,4-dihydroxy-2-naphthoate polyprenyltransferase [Carboxylicivirga sp. M1479]|uniref:1,4-dihydroxy-2-naphthoate polyprenyltransferase n=1 Tax=Carboxylicivirga sp. M1479 TaxID=2594476 RepID=UPI00117835D6|nr:1,4-dihydroxy-2-naphthoate polyprenyltransferase [Carboxylicivirga sp. M1479]TRX63255.1 1,4-dihydroxy-2-naphthoate polyprenyltransferase [Carboxylicivirga sp. M1479]
MTKVKAWVSAFRLRTLPLALSSIIMGGFLAHFYGAFNWSILVSSALTTLFLQVLSNLANDYGDTVNGADHEGREGPQRMVQTGAIGLSAMKKAIVVFAILSLLSGIILIYLAFRKVSDYQSILFFLIGLAAIGAAMKYTMGKNPYGYKGQGDIFVFIFFGLVGVAGSFYLYTQTINLLVLLPASSVGLLSAGVLNLNNMRDVKSDQEAGKHTLVVKLGISNAKKYHLVLVLVAIVTTVVFVSMHQFTPISFFFIVSLPFFARHLVVVHKASKADDFDPELKKLALSTLLFVFLFGFGLMMS